MKSISYVCKKLGLSSQTVKNHIKDGKLKAIKSLSVDNENRRYISVSPVFGFSYSVFITQLWFFN